MEGDGDRARLIPEDHPDFQTETVKVLLGEAASLGGLINPATKIRRQMHGDRRSRRGLLDPLGSIGWTFGSLRRNGTA